MALVYNSSPTSTLAGNAAKLSRSIEQTQRPSGSSSAPSTRDDQVAASLQSKSTAAGVSPDLARQVGGAKQLAEGRLDRSPERGIDRVSVSQKALDASRAAAAQAKAGALDSDVKPVINGAPGRFAALPQTEAADPTRFGKEAAALARRDLAQIKNPTGGIAPLFS